MLLVALRESGGYGANSPSNKSMLRVNVVGVKRPESVSKWKCSKPNGLNGSLFGIFGMKASAVDAKYIFRDNLGGHNLPFISV